MFDCEYANRKSFFHFTTSALFLPTPEKKMLWIYFRVCTSNVFVHFVRECCAVCWLTRLTLLVHSGEWIVPWKEQSCKIQEKGKTFPTASTHTRLFEQMCDTLWVTSDARTFRSLHLTDNVFRVTFWNLFGGADKGFRKSSGAERLNDEMVLFGLK